MSYIVLHVYSDSISSVVYDTMTKSIRKNQKMDYIELKIDQVYSSNWVLQKEKTYLISDFLERIFYYSNKSLLENDEYSIEVISYYDNYDLNNFLSKNGLILGSTAKLETEENPAKKVKFKKVALLIDKTNKMVLRVFFDIQSSQAEKLGRPDDMNKKQNSYVENTQTRNITKQSTKTSLDEMFKQLIIDVISNNSNNSSEQISTLSTLNQKMFKDINTVLNKVENLQDSFQLEIHKLMEYLKVLTYSNNYNDLKSKNEYLEIQVKHLQSTIQSFEMEQSNKLKKHFGIILNEYKIIADLYSEINSEKVKVYEKLNESIQADGVILSYLEKMERLNSYAITLVEKMKELKLMD